jgi:hypothetical protein
MRYLVGYPSEIAISSIKAPSTRADLGFCSKHLAASVAITEVAPVGAPSQRFRRGTP